MLVFLVQLLKQLVCEKLVKHTWIIFLRILLVLGSSKGTHNIFRQGEKQTHLSPDTKKQAIERIYLVLQKSLG